MRNDLVEFLQSVARPGHEFRELDDDVNLVDAGIIDSLALVQIIGHLEQRHGLSLHAGSVDPGDLGTIRGILNVIESRDT